MQKVLTILEKNVEWIAMGLAGLWVLWLVWAYVISAPVSVEINGESYSTGNVDEMINQTLGSKLHSMLADSNVPPMPKPQLTTGFAKLMDPPAPAPLPGLVFNSGAPRDWSSLQPTTPGDTPGVVAQADKVTELPVVPAPTIVEVQSQRDLVTIPASKAAPGAAPGNLPGGLPPGVVTGPSGEILGGGVYDPRVTGRPPLPGELPPGQFLPQPVPVAMAAPRANQVDKEWITVFGKFSEQALQESFNKAKIPAALSFKLYVQVQLVRQEKLPDDTWGNEKEIPPLPMHAPRIDKATFPEAYVDWAIRPENMPVVLTPPFYTTANNKWRTPGQPEIDPALQQVMGFLGPDGTFNAQQLAEQMKTMPVAEQNKIREKLTPQQRMQLTAAIEALKRQEQKEKATQRGGDREMRRPIRERPTGRRPAGDAHDPAILREMFAQAVPSRFNPYPNRPDAAAAPAAGPGMEPYPGGMPMAPGYGDMSDPSQSNIARPGGMRDAAGNIIWREFDIWAHDETVEAGKTYRYKMRLTIRNPLYNMAALVADPALAKVIELPVDKNQGWSEWTDAVEVRPRVQLFLAGGSMSGKEVRFEVYRWQNGKTNKSSAFTVGAGDIVGGLDKTSQIDFTTGWSVVDIRQVGNSDWRVTLVDKEGKLEDRHLRSDTTNPVRRDLEQEIAKAKPPAKPAGAPPMMPGVMIP